MTDPQPALQRLADAAGALYTLPTVAAEVLRLTNDPRVDVPLLKKCIENDPALAGRLLRVVNSSLFGLSRQVSNLNQALALLGTKPLKLLVLGFSLPRGMFAGVEGRILGRYWHHALVKAVAAREIADTMSPKQADEAFLVGLLQDIGMLVLIQQLGEPYLEFVARLEATEGVLRDAERETFGFDHAELSGCLLKTWGLPNLLVEAVAAGGEADLAHEGEWTLRQVAEMADEIALLLAGNRANALDRFLRRLRARAGQIPFDLEAAVLRIEKTVNQLADVLALDLPERQNYQELLSQAHARLAEVAADAAGELLLVDLERANEPPASAHESTELARAMDRLLKRGGLKPPPVEETTAPDTPPAPSRRIDPPRAPQPQLQEAATDDPSLRGRLAAFAASCRQQRAALSLMLVQFDDFPEAVFRHGADEGLELPARVGRLCEGLDCPGAVSLAVSETRFAVILPDCDRSRAVRLASSLIESVSAIAVGPAAADRPACGVSIGVASVAQLPKNFPASELVARADRCLFAALACGGGAVKSIEIC